MAKNERPARMWVYSPRAVPGSKVPDDVKSEVSGRACALVEEWSPTFIEKPPKGYKFNYIVNLYTKWRGNYSIFVQPTPARAQEQSLHRLSHTSQGWNTSGISGSTSPTCAIPASGGRSNED